MEAVMKKLDVVVAGNNRIEQIVTEIDARTVTIEGLQRATINKMDKHASGLRKCIQAAADDTVPTAFVIISHQPGTTPAQGVLDEINEAKETAGQLLAGESTGANFLKCGRQMLSLYHRGAGAMNTFQEAISDPKAFAFAKLKEHAMNTLFLSLVCEACWMPQTGAYEITVQGETCQQVMPIAKATLSTIKVLNGLAGLAQCFFPGLPSIPKSVLNEAKATIDQFDVESSVAEFDEIQSVLAKQDDDREQGKQDGYCRRQFKQLLAKEDPKNEWAKLKRALLPEGKSIWMCECCAKVLEKPDNKEKSYEELRELCKPQALKDSKVDKGAPEVVSGDGGGGGGEGGEGVASEVALKVLSEVLPEVLPDARKRPDGMVQQHSKFATGRGFTDQEAGTDLAELLQQHKDEIVSQVEAKLGTVMATLEERLDTHAKGVGSKPSLCQGVAEQPSMNQAAGNLTKQQKKKPNCVIS